MAVTNRLDVREQYVPTPDGWSLHLRRSSSPQHFDSKTRPLLIVPGYGMNSFIFSYHPRGTSMVRHLAEKGFEVWTLNLRGQGHSRTTTQQPPPPSLHDYASTDLPAAIERILETSRTESDTLSLIGCSLGGSIAYGYLTLHMNHSVAELVTMGAPLHWTKVHPLLKLLFASPKLAASVRLTDTRKIVRSAMPFLQGIPSLLSLYMNTRSIDMDHIDEMANTVEDPEPNINREIAMWIRRGALDLGGVNLTDAVRGLDLPLLVVLSNKDGIVPEATAMSAVDAWGGDDIEVLRVGDETNWYAHANLFVANDAPSLVFKPLTEWLQKKQCVENQLGA